MLRNTYVPFMLSVVMLTVIMLSVIILSVVVPKEAHSFKWTRVGARHLGSAKANGREPKSCLGQVFNFKFGCFGYEHNCMV